MKKALAMLLALVMLVSLLAACASDNNTANDNNTSNQTNTPSDNQSQDNETNNDANNDEEEVPPEEMPVIEIAFVDVDDRGDAYKKVEEALDALSREKIGVGVSMNLFNLGSYTTNIGMMIAGGEQLDLVNTAMLNFGSMYSMNQLTDLSELLPEYAPDAYALMKDYLIEINGGVYMVPTYRNYSSNEYYFFREDILEDLGLEEEARAISSWSEMEDLFAKVYASDHIDKSKNMYLIGGYNNVIPATNFGWADDTFASSWEVERIGDNTYSICAEDDVVKNNFATERVQNLYKRAASWSEKGWVYPEVFVSQDMGEVQMQNGLIFAFHSVCEFGAEPQKEMVTHQPLVAVEISKGQVNTSNLQGIGLVVPYCAQEPEAAMKFLNLIYTDAEAMNMLCWGMEGTDYVVKDTGEAAWPEGSDGKGLYHSYDYLNGNMFLLKPWDGKGGDFYAEAAKDNEKVKLSKYLGFTLDTEDYATEIAAITATVNEYKIQLTCGAYTDELYNAFLGKLDAAGINNYIDGVQKQLDAWLAAK